MCTLTIYSGKKRCVVTMNRDERRTRHEAGVLYSRSVNDIRLFHPVDLASGGSWFGANNRDVILALLNRYQPPAREGTRSRGEIIPAALAQGDFNAVNAWLEAKNYAYYAPFDLFLVSRKQHRQFSWDGGSLEHRDLTFKHWFMACSSAIQDEEVIAFRRHFFNAWCEEMGKKLLGADEILRGFHLIQIPGMESQSVLMERELSHTKSVIQADIEGRHMTLKYLPEVLEKFPDSPLGDIQVESFDIRKPRKAGS